MASRDRYPMIAWRNWVDETMPSSLSTSSMTANSTTKTFATAVPAPAYYVGAPIELTATSDLTTTISGTIATWNPTLGSGSFTVSSFTGSGTHVAWSTTLNKWDPTIGTYYSALPLANLQNDKLSVVTRSTGNTTPNARMRCDFGSNMVINMACFPRHNLSENSKWRIRLMQVAATTGKMTVIYDSGFIKVWPTVEPFGQDLWGVMAWGGSMLLGDNYDPPAVHVMKELVSTTSVTSLTVGTGQITFTVADASELQVPQTLTLCSDADNLLSMSAKVTNINGSIITAQVTHTEGAGTAADWTVRTLKNNGDADAFFGRFLQIDVDDSGNDNSYVQFSRLVAGPAWQPSGSFDYGCDIEHIDESRRSRSRGGQFYVDIVPKYRRVRFTISGIDKNEMYSQGYEIDRVKGVGRAILVIIDPTDSVNLHRQTVYGSLASTSPIAQRRVNSYEKQFVQEEWV